MEQLIYDAARSVKDIILDKQMSVQTVGAVPASAKTKEPFDENGGMNDENVWFVARDESGSPRPVEQMVPDVKGATRGSSWSCHAAMHVGAELMVCGHNGLTAGLIRGRGITSSVAPRQSLRQRSTATMLLQRILF